MKKQSKYRRKIVKTQRQSFIIGVFLVLIGIALFVVLQGTEGEAAAPVADLSVVPVAVNYPAPQLALENVNGETESLEDFSGQVLLLNNWATWCPPCKAEMPTLKKFHDAHSAEGFTIIAVEAGDGKDEVLQFANSLNLTFPIWLDPDGAALNAFKNGNLPNSYVIDRSGTVRYAWTGEISLAMLEKYVTPLIVENN